MEELLQQLADQTGVPTDLLERAAAARAAVSGASTESIIAGWAGAEIPEAAAASPPPAAAPAAVPAPAAQAPVPAAVEPGPVAEVLSPTADPAVAPDDQGVDAEVTDELIPMPVLSGFPGWLAASFVILPMIAVLYALLTPNAPDCGAAGQLAIDPVTGVAENCDGTPYGVDIVNFFTIGEEVYELRCASCHGADGSGGVGPAFAGGAVLVTFPTCESHLSWVGTGSDAWEEPTYGATGKAVRGTGPAMPGFGEPILTEEELAAVVLYERVQFGAETLPDAESGCGLADDDEVVAASS